MKIEMNDFGLETYASSLDALKAFAANIQESETKLNAILDWEYTDEDLKASEIWDSEESMEGIKERVKEMASKAKSNIVAWAQKLINLVFGFITRIISGNKVNSQVLKRNYESAVTYIKSLKEMENVAKSTSGKIKISDWGHSNLQIMVLILAISYSITHTVKEMKELVSGIYTKSVDQSDPNKMITFSLNLQVILGLIRKMIIMCGLIMSVNVFEGDFLKEFEAVGYDYSKLIEKSSSLKYNTINVDMSKAIQAIKSIMDDMKDPKNNDVFGDFKRIKDIYDDANVKHTRAAAMKYMSQNLNRIKNPRTSELEYKVAYDYILENLELFVTVSNANADLWKFDKHIKDAEVLRRKLNQVVELIRYDSEDYMRFILGVIVDVGGIFSTVVKNVETAAKSHDEIMHNFMDDSIKLGRLLKREEASRQANITKQQKQNMSTK